MTEQQNITITQRTEGGITIDTNQSTYTVLRDDYTGDWSVVEDTATYPQQTYLTSKEDAIRYVLSHIGFIDATVERAPDRC